MNPLRDLRNMCTRQQITQPCAGLCFAMGIEFDDHAVGANGQQTTKRPFAHLCG